MKNNKVIGRPFVRIPVNDNFLDAIGKKQAWFIGLMAADGCVVNDRQFSLSQSSERGRILIDTVKTMIGYAGNIRKHKNAYRFQACSPKLVMQLAKFNIVPRKSLIYTFPKLIKEDEQLRAFVRGI